MAGETPATGRQRPGDVLSWFFDFSNECFRFREPATSYALNTVVRPPVATGYEYKATTAGQTAGSSARPSAPRWPTKVGETVTDGSVVWTAQALSAAGIARTVDAKTVSTDTGLTVVSSTLVNQNDRQCITVQLTSITDGETLDCEVQATFSDGEKAELALRLSISSQEAAAE